MLTQEQVDFYREHGYLVVEDVLRPDELEEAHAIVDDFVEQSRHVSEQSGHFDLEPGHTPENPKVRRLSAPASYHPFFGGLMRDSRILDRLTPLIGPAIRAQGDKLNMKPADGGSPVEWHQDFAHYPHTNDDLCAVGVALDDATEENGCMMVVPGSHQGPILDHHQDGYFIGAHQPRARRDRPLFGCTPSDESRFAFHPPRPHFARLGPQPLGYVPATLAVSVRGRGRLGRSAEWATGIPLTPTFCAAHPPYDFRLVSMTARTRMPAGARGGGGIYELQKPLQEKVFAAG